MEQKWRKTKLSPGGPLRDIVDALEKVKEALAEQKEKYVQEVADLQGKADAMKENETSA